MENLKFEKDFTCRNILLSTACFPSISYLKSILQAQQVFIEQYENYIKQSYRNRYNIYAANGILPLSIPVILATNKKIKIKDVRIDYETDWQKQHFKSIESAYRSTPFFEYLIDDFLPFFTERHTFLFDFNLSILNTILNILEIDIEFKLTDDYEKLPIHKQDLRNIIHPKKENFLFSSYKVYPQVFADKFGYQNDLSCLDLLFNLGSEAYSYLYDKY
jgi:hypothetical protein